MTEHEPTPPVLSEVDEAERVALRPSGRLSTRRRNQICIAVIAIGLVNFVVYTLSYAVLGGDAHNGYRAVVTRADGTRTVEHYVRGHFIHDLEGRERQVSATVWIYSYLHSILVPLTSGAMIISMLVLARPHIIATMRDSWISGQTFVGTFGIVVIVVTLAVVALFTADFVAQLSRE